MKPNTFYVELTWMDNILTDAFMYRIGIGRVKPEEYVLKVAPKRTKKARKP